jgi:chemotaxis protein MotB
MAGYNDPPIIIKRIKKKGHAAHHGGAWKVAYADFVTAMMAFFLLLWLLNVTTDIQRRGIADYFAPANIASSSSGAGGILGGLTISAPGAEVSNSTAPGQDDLRPNSNRGEGEADEAPENSTDKTGTQKKGDQKPGDKSGGKADIAEDALDAAIAKRDAEQFKAAEEALRNALMQVPELQALAENLIIDVTPEGLRIQIIDQDKYSIFPSGSAEITPRSRELMTMVGRVVTRLPNRITVSGHTDATPFNKTSGRDNWTLSADRANACRLVLTAAGVDDTRIVRVAGLADRDPLLPDAPTSPQNRRISIILVRQKKADMTPAARKSLDVVPQDVKPQTPAEPPPKPPTGFVPLGGGP